MTTQMPLFSPIQTKAMSKTGRKTVCVLTFISLALWGGNGKAQTINRSNLNATNNSSLVQPSNLIPKEYPSRSSWKNLQGEITLYMANDLGRNGYYDQKTIAELMGEMAGTVDPKCVLAVGDIHHFNGIASLQDPLWLTNYEWIYSHPDLMIDWFPVCGNHEYRGNTDAILKYGTISRRWMMPGKYYSRTFTGKKTSLRVVFLDTSPLIDKYRNDSVTYPDACKENMQKQLDWLDNTLKNAKEDWVIVVGHHPIYAETGKSIDERMDMQKRVKPILQKYGNVAIYAAGHIHNFQHIHMKNDKTEYVVNSSASLSRPVKETEGTQYCSSSDGFSVLTVDKTQLRMSFIDKDGNILYEIKKTK